MWLNHFFPKHFFLLRIILTRIIYIFILPQMHRGGVEADRVIKSGLCQLVGLRKPKGFQSAAPPGKKMIRRYGGSVFLAQTVDAADLGETCAIYFLMSS